MKKVSVILLLAVMILFCQVFSVSAESFGVFDVFIIDPGADPEGENGDSREGLSVQTKKWEIYESWDGEWGDTYVWAALNVTIQNWTLETLNIADSLSATLTFRDEYTFTAFPSFPLTNLGMVERMDGQLVFKVPHMVALAQPGELELTIKALDSESWLDPDLTAAASALKKKTSIPFTHAQTDGNLEFFMDTAYISDNFEGSREDVARWLIQEVQVINWSREDIPLNLYGNLVYLDRYVFRGIIREGKGLIHPLEIVQFYLAVRLPVAVTEAGKGETELWIVNEVPKKDEYREDFHMAAAVKKTYQDLEEYCIIEPVPNAQYGFTATGDGWFESQNQGVANSYSLCILRFKTAESQLKLGITSSHEEKSERKYNSYSHSYYSQKYNCDFGLISMLDTSFSLDNSDESATRNYLLLTNEDQVYTIDVPDNEEHFIYIKYKKDGGGNNGIDALRFHVVEFPGICIVY